MNLVPNAGGFSGVNLVDFGFEVDDRFVLLTTVTVAADSTTNVCAAFEIVNGVPLGCATSSNTQLAFVSFSTNSGNPINAPFWIFVF
jgi:hypothetical protein